MGTPSDYLCKAPIGHNPCDRTVFRLFLRGYLLSLFSLFGMCQCFPPPKKVWKNDNLWITRIFFSCCPCVLLPPCINFDPTLFLFCYLSCCWSCWRAVLLIPMLLLCFFCWSQSCMYPGCVQRSWDHYRCAVSTSFLCLFVAPPVFPSHPCTSLYLCNIRKFLLSSLHFNFSSQDKIFLLATSAPLPCS